MLHRMGKYDFIQDNDLSRDSHVDAQYAAHGIAGLEKRLEHGHDVYGANPVAIVKFAFPAFCRSIVKYVLDHGFVIGEVFDGNYVFQRLIDDFVGACKTAICCKSVVASENSEVAVYPENTNVREIEK